MSSINLLAQKNDCCPFSEVDVRTERRRFINVTVGVIMLSETLLGSMGNSYFLYHYLLFYHTEGRVRTTGFILMHLAVSNILLILSKGSPKTLAVWGLKNFLSDLGCHLFLYIHRVSRIVSISIIGLLSVFQTIKISPVDSCWNNLKFKAPQYVTVTVPICWILHACVNLYFPMHMLYVSSKWSLKSIQKQDMEFCQATEDKNLSIPVYLAFTVFPELSFSVLIVWSSCSMILFLYRHKQRVQHLHRNQVFSRSSAESRATKKILVLVSTFVCFHTLSSIFHMCISLFNDKKGWLINTADIVSLCFPTVIPFLIMRHDSTVFQQTFAIMRCKKRRTLNTEISSLQRL